MAAPAFIRCPQCNTVIEKPATGAPVCPNCGFGAPKATAKKSAAKTAKTASKATAAAPAAWAPAPTTPPVPQASPFPQTPGLSPMGQGMPQKNSGKAVAALVLGIVGCCIWVVPFVGPFVALPAGILALVFGILGAKEVKRDPATFKGNGMAVTGIVLGSIMILVGLVLVLAVTIGLSAIDEYCADNPDNPACEDYEENRSVQDAPYGLAVGSTGERPTVAAGLLAQPWRA